MPIDLYKPNVRPASGTVRGLSPSLISVRRAIIAGWDSRVVRLRSSLADLRSGSEPIYDPAGIGGWLVIPAFTTYLLPVIFANDLLDIVDDVQRYPASGSVILGRVQITACSLLILFSLTLIRSFQARSKRYPLLFVCLLATHVLVTLLHVNVGMHVLHQPWTSHEATQITVSLCFCWISSAYLLLSRRVRHTFVR